ncbi:MAG: hypothetical protein ABIX00_11680 [Polaromonas sp.]
MKQNTSEGLFMPSACFVGGLDRKRAASHLARSSIARIFAEIFAQETINGAMINGSADDKAACLKGESVVRRKKKLQIKFDPASKTGI